MENLVLISITTTIVKFIDPNGLVSISEVEKADGITPEENYDFVTGADGNTWLLNEIVVLDSLTIEQTEFIDMGLDEEW